MFELALYLSTAAAIVLGLLYLQIKINKGDF